MTHTSPDGFVRPLAEEKKAARIGSSSYRITMPSVSRTAAAILAAYFFACFPQFFSAVSADRNAWQQFTSSQMSASGWLATGPFSTL